MSTTTENYIEAAVPNATLLCVLAPFHYGSQGLSRIWKHEDGQFTVHVYSGGVMGGSWKRATTAQAAGVMRRYIARQNLTLGQLLHGRFVRPIKKNEFGNSSFSFSEPCRFIAYADEARTKAVVYDLNGKAEVIDTFEPIFYRHNDAVWAKIADRWVSGYVDAVVGRKYEVQFSVDENPTDPTAWPWGSLIVDHSMLLPWECSVPCKAESRVEAFINGRWVRGCTYKSGSNEPGGVHTVVTFWNRTRTATRVRPTVTTASAGYRLAVAAA